MKNINFDNPLLLLLAIPVIALVVAAFLICRNKDNRGFGWSVSLGLHVAIVLLASLALAGFSTVSVLTRTTVYVVADVSYSSDQNLDQIDAYIAQIKDALPANSSLGVVCFGKDSVILTSPGRTLKSVKEAKPDNSATDIVGALTFTEGLFQKDVQKRIVLITDGNDTVTQNVGSLAATVSRMTERGIKIDAIYLDNTPKEGQVEVQLSDVDFSRATYTGLTSEATILLQASLPTMITLELYSRPISTSGTPAEFQKIDTKSQRIEDGLTTIKMHLPTTTAGSFEYRATVAAENDHSNHNNTRTFVQSVTGKNKILLVSGSDDDRLLVERMYGAYADIDSYVVKTSGSYVPVTLEELIEYDEIILSNLDVRYIRNVNAFIDSLDMAVSQYGKSLVTLGNLELQTNSEDTTFQKLAELLPVKFGHTGRDGRLYTIVFDVSSSMFYASKFFIAKDAAIRLLSVMSDDDHVALVTFSGGQPHTIMPERVKDCKEDLAEVINGLTVSNGSDIGLGLDKARQLVESQGYTENQIILISDGITFSSTVDAQKIAAGIANSNTPAVLTTLVTYIPDEGTVGSVNMMKLASVGGGQSYSISSSGDVDQVVFGEMADKIGDVIIEKDSSVAVERYNDAIVSGLGTIPPISGFIVSVGKYDATVPLTVSYVKNNGYQETVPLYAYRAHGNGRVASLTSSLSGNWTRNWTADDKSGLLSNILLSNTPSERVDYPFTLNVEKSEYDTYFEIVPSVLDPDAVTTLRITYPDKRSVTHTLPFDSQKYFYTLPTTVEGVYTVNISYSYGEKNDQKVYETSFTVDIPYLPEYNAFADFDRFHVYEFMRDSGRTLEGEIPSLENNETEITTYKMSFTVPLLIAAIVLFLVDIVFRKLKRGKKKTAMIQNPA